MVNVHYLEIAFSKHLFADKRWFSYKFGLEVEHLNTQRLWYCK